MVGPAGLCGRTRKASGGGESLPDRLAEQSTQMTAMSSVFMVLYVLRVSRLFTMLTATNMITDLGSIPRIGLAPGVSIHEHGDCTSPEGRVRIRLQRNVVFGPRSLDGRSSCRRNAGERECEHKHFKKATHRDVPLRRHRPAGVGRPDRHGQSLPPVREKDLLPDPDTNVPQVTLAGAGSRGLPGYSRES